MKALAPACLWGKDFVKRRDNQCFFAETKPLVFQPVSYSRRCSFLKNFTRLIQLGFNGFCDYDIQLLVLDVIVLDQDKYSKGPLQVPWHWTLKRDMAMPDYLSNIAIPGYLPAAPVREILPPKEGMV